MEYTLPVFDIQQTADYRKWFEKLGDRQARARINARIRRLQLGNAGDVKPAGGNVSELRIDYGPGYRVYFVRRGLRIIILLAGGDKRTQNADIKKAQRLALVL